MCIVFILVSWEKLINAEPMPETRGDKETEPLMLAPLIEEEIGESEEMHRFRQNLFCLALLE